VNDIRRGIYEFYARGTSYEDLHEYNRIHSSKLWDRFVDDTAFKFSVNAYMHTIPQRRQREVVESFSYMDFRGKIDMKNPDIVLCCFEECTSCELCHTSIGY
jgi:tRNA (guanine10-N2)-methyltransferase